MTGDQYRAELDRLRVINEEAKAEVSRYVGRVSPRERTTIAEDRAFEDAVSRIDETWPLIVQLLRQAPDVAATDDRG